MSAVKNVDGKTPYSKDKKNDSQRKISHDYFIPVILTIVLCVVIVATFFDSNSSNTLTNADTSIQHNDISVAKDQIALNSVVPSPQRTQNAEDKTESPAAEKQHDGILLPVNKASAAITTSPTKSADWHSSVPSSENNNNAFNQREYTERVYPRYAPPGSREDAYRQRSERNRRAYEEHLQRRQQHLEEMQHYRNTVLRQIEKDRIDLRKRMYELDAEARRIHLEAEKRRQLLESNEPHWTM